MFKKTKVCSGLTLAFGGSLALSALPVLAQQAVQFDRIEVTGSSIKRLADEQSLPVTVLKADDLAKSGVTNAEQAMSFVTANQSATVSSSSVGASNGGSSFADLRGLGASRTLTLVNGQRMVNNPYLSAAVDINALPFGAVDRIEVLTDGASAIYGTDAIAGVVNFITRKEYKGASVFADGSWPTSTPGDGRQASYGGTLGFGSLATDGWNIFGGVSYRLQEALAAKDRDYAKTAYIPSEGYNKTSGTTFPATYTQSGVSGSFNPSLPTCAPPTSLRIGANCRFDYVPFIDIVPSQNQLSIIGKGSYAVNKDNTVSLEYIQANNELATAISPTPVTGLSMSPNNPFYPGKGITPGNTNASFDPTKPINLAWRQATLGGRASEVDNTTYRWLAQWEGSYKDWDYNVSAFYSDATVKQNFTGGYVNSTMLRNGLLGLNGAPYLNPFGAQSAEGLAYLGGAKILGQVQQADGTLYGVNAHLSGAIWKLPAGPMMLAVGVEYLNDKADYTNNFTLIRQAASSGLELTEDSSGSRHDAAISAELNIPIVKNLDVNLAVRYDDYSDFGGTTNPKISFRWQPIQALLFRGSYNEGFRAPTLQDAYSPNSITYTGGAYDDPLLCPGGKVNTALAGVETRDCGMQFQQQQGGNRNLKPETSEAWTIGFFVQPINSFTFGMDYWNYKVDSSIGVTGEEVIFGDPAKYSALYIRCGQLSAADQAKLIGTCTGNPNILAYITNTQLNLGTYKTSGLDFTSTWQSDATSFGKFNVGYRGTYVMQYEYQLEPGGPFNNNNGVYFNGGPVARYRHVLNFGWNYGPWSAVLVDRYTSKYEDQNTDVNDNVRNVAANDVWDISGTWSGVKGLSLTLGLTNMFNTKPPFSNQSDAFQVGYDWRYGNPIGRAVLGRVTYQF